MRFAAIIVTVVVAGCQHERLPTYRLLDVKQTCAALARHAADVKTASASGALELRRSDGRHVRLDLAVALKPPDIGRLRAWKFGQAVFDLTIHGDEVWLELQRDDKNANERITATARQLARVWRLLNGSLFNDSNLRSEMHGDRLRLERRVANEPTIVCVVNRDTLTPRQYVLLDDAGRVRFSLELDHYRAFGNIVWPMRMIATSESGRIVIELRQVDMNAELSPAAFKPPRRAEKLP